VAEAAAKRQAEVEALQEELKESWVRQEESERELARKQREIEQLEKIASAPKPPCPEEMVFIAGGTFPFGSAREDRDRNDLVEKEAEPIPIQSFCIDRYEYPNRKGKTPVAGIDWTGAAQTCVGEGKRLCTQEEWERTCKGSSATGNPRYPYGDTWDPLICNTKGEGIRELAPSGAYERCVTPEGVFDMSGNLEEWTANRGPGAETRIVKGGSRLRPSYQGRCASLRWVQSSAQGEEIGFRCCKDSN
jgi:formylglycine-generating enzyme required for sulfatase activity